MRKPIDQREIHCLPRVRADQEEPLVRPVADK